MGASDPSLVALVGSLVCYTAPPLTQRDLDALHQSFAIETALAGCWLRIEEIVPCGDFKVARALAGIYRMSDDDASVVITRLVELAAKETEFPDISKGAIYGHIEKAVEGFELQDWDAPVKWYVSWLDHHNRNAVLHFYER